MRGGRKLKQEVVGQIKEGDYLISKKDRAVLICTSLINKEPFVENPREGFWCFEVLGELDNYGEPTITIFDRREILQFEGTLIKKNSKEAKKLEILYAKI